MKECGEKTRMFKQCDRDWQYHPVAINSLSLTYLFSYCRWVTWTFFCNSTSKDKGKHAVSSRFVAPLLYFSSLDFTSLSNKGKHAFSTVSTSFVSYVRFWNLRTLLILNPIRVIWHCRVILVAIPRDYCADAVPETR